MASAQATAHAATRRPRTAERLTMARLRLTDQQQQAAWFLIACVLMGAGAGILIQLLRT